MVFLGFGLQILRQFPNRGGKTCTFLRNLQYLSFPTVLPVCACVVFNVNLTFIETTPRLPEFVTYLQRTLDFLNSMGLMATGGERLGIYLNGLKISGSAQCLYKDRVLYHCTLLYDTDLTALHQALNPEPMVDDEMLSSVYAVPSVRSEVTNIRRHLSAGTVTDFKEKAFQYFSKSQSVSAFTKEEIEAVNQLREEKYIQKEWIYSR